jgi:5'-phosphate synthase pdxT subunit
MVSPRKQVGVLALQGAVEPHRRHIETLGFDFVEVRRPEQLASLSALILPGGESTTLLKLIEVFGFEKPLLEASQRIPFWGICAGSILMAKNVQKPAQKSLGLVSMSVERNSYGRQLDSFHAKIQGFEVAFIRAPKFIDLESQVEVLDRYADIVVAAKEGRHFVSSFHAELNPQAPSPFHRRFLVGLNT